MAKGETDIVHGIMVDTSKIGVRLFKNVRGGFYPVQAVKPLLLAVMNGRLQEAIALARNIRPLLAGLLMPGASDLIGFTVREVTADMVGQKVAIFTAVEVKVPGGKATPEQLNFVDVVRKNGGLSGVAHNSDEARKIIQNSA